MSTRTQPDFDGALCSAIDETVVELLGRSVLEALYVGLRNNYGITRDELPCRTETFLHVLEIVFGVRGAKTIGINISQKFYGKMGLEFDNHEGYTLFDYVQEAKSKLNNMLAYRNIR